MQPCECSLSGTATVDSANVVTAWDFTDGTHELTTANTVSGGTSPTGAFGVGTFSVSWFLRLTSNTDWTFYIDYYGSAFEENDASWGGNPVVSFGGEQGHPGVWTEDGPVGTPEPGTLALIGVGLAGLWARRRLQARRNHVPRAVWEPLD